VLKATNRGLTRPRVGGRPTPSPLHNPSSSFFVDRIEGERIFDWRMTEPGRLRLFPC
jgi:hypothetical protein